MWAALEEEVSICHHLNQLIGGHQYLTETVTMDRMTPISIQVATQFTAAKNR
jgi:hypothetical protein